MEKIIERFKKASEILEKLESTEGNLVYDSVKRLLRLANGTTPPSEIAVESHLLSLRSAFISVILKELDKEV